MNNDGFISLHFKELSPEILYQILQLRQNVFVLEQQCLYPDLDEIDLACVHLWRSKNGKIVSTARIVPPGLVYKEASIGRVCTALTERRNGEGKKLMIKAIESIESLYGKIAIKIGAQLYLEKFYNEFGFQKVSEPYDEDGILHIKMLRA